MARKSITFTLQDGNNNLKFKATQMPATKMERFIIKLAAIALHGGVANSFNGLPDGKGIADISWSDVDVDALLKSLGNVNVDEVTDLGNELLNCCALVTSDGMEQEITPDNIDAIIEDVGSLFKLKKKAFEVNFSGFTKGDKLDKTQDLPPKDSGFRFSKSR